MRQGPDSSSRKWQSSFRNFGKSMVIEKISFHSMKNVFHQRTNRIWNWCFWCNDVKPCLNYQQNTHQYWFKGFVFVINNSRFDVLISWRHHRESYWRCWCSGIEFFIENKLYSVGSVLGWFVNSFLFLYCLSYSKHWYVWQRTISKAKECLLCLRC